MLFQRSATQATQPADIQLKYNEFKSMLATLKTTLDNAIANSPDSQLLFTP